MPPTTPSDRPAVAPEHHRRQGARALACALLVAGTLVAYGQAIRADFVGFDDPIYVTGNEHIRRGLTWEGVRWAFTSEHGGNWHPLTGISHMLDCELYGLDPAGHHLTSVILHVLNTVLLFGTLQVMTGAVWRSAFVAALFALHPLHVESVAWVSERKDVLSTAFGLLALWSYGNYVTRGGKHRYALTLALFTLALMAKAMLVTLPFVFLLVDYWPLGRLGASRVGVAVVARPAAERRRSRLEASQRPSIATLVIEKIPFLLLSIIASVIAVAAQRDAGGVLPAAAVPLHARLANALVSYVRYLWRMLWPADLSVLYPHPNLPGGTPWSMGLVVAAGVLLVAVTLASLRATRHPYLAVGWLWYLGTLVPVIGIVQVGIQAMADRYTYLPLIGPLIIVAWGVPELAARSRGRDGRGRRGALAVLATAAVVAALVASRRQVRYWRSSVALFRHSVRAEPTSPLLHYDLAEALAATGRSTEAIAEYRAALRIDPGYASAHNNIGVALQARGKLNEAMAHFRSALAARPGYTDALINLGAALRAQGRVGEAIDQYRQALRLDPQNAEASYDLGVALHVEGRLEEAIEHYRAALSARPDYADAHNNLGLALQARGELTAAIKHYRRALAIAPDLAEARHNLRALLAAQGTQVETQPGEITRPAP